MLEPSVYSWLDAHAIADEAVGEAYESLGDTGRAVLKKCIARLYRVFGEAVPHKRGTQQFREGFVLEEAEAPAAFALLVCEARYAAPAAFLAALMPAVLAGVEHVIPCFLADGEDKSMPAGKRLLAALELAGVERAFASDEPDLVDLLHMLRHTGNAGRMLMLGNGPFSDAAALAAHRAAIPCLSLIRPPVYYSGRLCAATEQRFGVDEAVFVAGADEEQLFLHLDLAHEDVWVWPDLPPAWFRSRRMRLFMR